MKGLIIKDLKLTARTTTRAMLIVYGLLIIYMGYVSKEGAGLIISVLLGMVIGMSVLTTMTLDEGTGWFKQERLLPLSLKEKVGAKYLLLIALLLPASLLLVPLAALIPLIFPAARFADIGLMLAALWCLTLIYNAVSIPVTYRFGSKSRVITMLLIIFPSTSLMGGMQGGSIPAMLARQALPAPLLMILLVLLAITLYAASFPLSCRMYRRYID